MTDAYAQQYLFVGLLAGIFHPEQCGDLIACAGCQAW